MPTEIALLPMVESAYQPDRDVDEPRGRASGSSCRRPESTTASQQNFWMDSRRDVVAATDKALDYLSKLHGDFNDWQLALAGYNWGEGNVAKRASRGTRQRACRHDYDSLTDARRRRAITCRSCRRSRTSSRDPEKYGLALADIPDAPYFAVVQDDAQDGHEASRPRLPRCRSTSSSRSIRSTTGR